MGIKGSKRQEEGGNASLLTNPENSSEDFVETDAGVDIRSHPFTALHKQLQGKAFNKPGLKWWIPGCPVRISFEDTFFKDRTCWFTIDLEHGCFRWTLQRRYRDILHLHHQLQLHRAVLSFRLPDIKYNVETDRRRPSIVIARKQVPKLPEFPSAATISQRRSNITWKMEALELYLQAVLNVPDFRNSHDVLEFLEVGPYSFVEELGLKAKEGFVHRRSNCGQTMGNLAMMCTVACGFRKKRWLFLKENFVGLVDPSRGELECVLLLDHGFVTKGGRRKTGHSQVMVIQNLTRKLVLRCPSKQQAFEWAEELGFALDRGLSDFVSMNRYDSFCPPRSLTECKWIVDGATYFDAVAVAMESAKEEIFIADWWLSPEIYLRRPTTQGHYWQLDYVLKRKAREGVKIYVLLYKELELALGINSLHTGLRLSCMHPNIQVLRHPQVTKGVLLWAHHEKIVCIDQTYAFAGGLDLCYGRWDDYQHRLTDLGEVQEKIEVKRHASKDPTPSAAEFMRRSSSLPDITKSFEATKEDMDIAEDDDALRHSFQSGMPVTPLKEENDSDFLKKDPPNRIKLKTLFKKYQARNVFEGIKRRLSSENIRHKGADADLSQLDQPADRDRQLREVALLRLNLEKKYRLWHGKDYVNFLDKDFEQLEKPYSDMIDRSCTPRMPWHDVGIFAQGMVARDIARHFILRWNHAKEEICPKNADKSFLMPKCYSTFIEVIPPILQDTVGSLYRAECQVLRSLCFWSGNLKRTEDSIHKAYLSVIRESKKFIYIENQFFISQPLGSSCVYNELADALFNRILKAYREKSEFHVFVVMPLLPAFEGEVGTGTGTLIQAITHWNYKSICKGNCSLQHRLERHMKDWSKFITFYGLRTHGALDGKPVTEIVYVHSKILIADDQVAIIGSANINDRSLLGRRDSEIAVITRDTHFLEDPPDAGEFCYSLRCSLFKEHLGLMHRRGSRRVDMRNPGKAAFFQDVWHRTASDNTDIYEDVFKCIPTDRATTFEDLKAFQRSPKLIDTDPEAAAKKLKRIRGFLVLLPLDFLANENLEPRYATKERYLPSSTFT